MLIIFVSTAGKFKSLIEFLYCRFVSFCRVGTGLTDEELDAVATKLKPYLRYYFLREKKKKNLTTQL